MNPVAIGQQIKHARENAHLSQEELGCIVHCTTQHISAIERGIKVPRMDTFLNIANALHVSADLLLQDELAYLTYPSTDEISMLISSLSEFDRQRIVRSLRAFVQEE